MRLFKVNSQQVINLLHIQIIDDFGHDFEITMLNGRKFRCDGGSRERFLSALAQAASA